MNSSKSSSNDWVIIDYDGVGIETDDQGAFEAGEAMEGKRESWKHSKGILAGGAIKKIEPSDAYRRRNGIGAGQPITKQIAEPPANRKTVEDFMAKARKSVESKDTVYRIDDGQEMSWAALRIGMINKEYDGALGPYWIAQYIKRKGHTLFEKSAGGWIEVGR